jgi:hypothetical protein
MAVPSPRKEPVAEASYVDGLGGFFSQEVVDTVDLVFPEDRMGGLVELVEGLHRGAERLFVDDPGPVR